MKPYVLTDRPVYRPFAPVWFKFWVCACALLRSAGPVGSLPVELLTVEITNPRHEKVFTKQFTADSFGGFDGSFELPLDAITGGF